MKFKSIKYKQLIEEKLNMITYVHVCESHVQFSLNTNAVCVCVCERDP